MVRRDSQRRVDVPERVRIVRLGSRGRGFARSGRSSPHASCGTRSPSRADPSRDTGRGGRPDLPPPHGVQSSWREGRAGRRPSPDSGSTSCRGRSHRQRCAGRCAGTSGRDLRARNDVRTRRGSRPAGIRRTRSPPPGLPTSLRIPASAAPVRRRASRPSARALGATPRRAISSSSRKSALISSTISGGTACGRASRPL